MITTKVKWKAIFVSLFFLCLYLFLLYIVIFIAVYITYTYTTDEDDTDSRQELAEKGYTLPEYAFVVECGGATSGESGVLEVRGWIRTQFKDKRTGNPIRNCKYTVYLLDGRKLEGFTDKDGFVELQRLEKGSYFIVIEKEWLMVDKNKLVQTASEQLEKKKSAKNGSNACISVWEYAGNLLKQYELEQNGEDMG